LDGEDSSDSDKSDEQSQAEITSLNKTDAAKINEGVAGK
jgi:hypothetical protein